VDKIETHAEEVLELVNEYEEIKLSVASAKTGIDKASLENLARTLEQYGALKIVYPIIGEPILKKTNKTLENIKNRRNTSPPEKEKRKTKLEDLLSSMKTKEEKETTEKQSIMIKTETKPETKPETKKIDEEIIEDVVPVFKPETKTGEVKPKVEEKKTVDIKKDKKEDSDIHADDLISEYEEIKKKAEEIKKLALEKIQKERLSLSSEASNIERDLRTLDLTLKNLLNEKSKLESEKRKIDEEINEIMKRKTEVESKLKALNSEEIENKIFSLKDTKKKLEEKIEKLMEKEKKISSLG